jgi:phosphoribosylamine---glycine ligase
MKFLFVSLIGDSLALMQELSNEGHQVRCFMTDHKFDDVGRGIIPRVRDWRQHKDWADVIVFDDANLGYDTEVTRKQGYMVVGGNRFGDRLENERSFGQKILGEAEINFPKSWKFRSFSNARKFVQRRKKRYVVKFNGQLARYLSYIGLFDDGSDVLEMLDYCQIKWPRNKRVDFIIQEYVLGIEMAVGAFFNGTDFAYPVNVTFEHKHFLVGSVGPLTPEMGTTMYYSKDGGKLFRETLLKMKPYLKKTNYRGFIDLNCMVTQEGAYVLEFTTRFGYPQLDIQLPLHKTSWGELLRKLAEGTLDKFEVSYDFAVGVVMGGPGVPFEHSYNKYGRGLPVLGFNNDLREQIKLTEVYKRNDKYYCAGYGYAITAVGLGRTMKGAKDKAYHALKKVIIPNCVYRTDIGDHWEKDAPLLKKWGYI